MITVKTIKVAISVVLFGLYSSVLLAGNVGVDGSVTATTFIGNGAGLTGVVTDGVEVGDMQYWDGDDWVLIPAPPTHEVTLTSCKGVPRWSSTDCIYTIGETGPAGGIVFHTTDGGIHGLEAAPADQGNGTEWGCYGTHIPGADGIAVGTGAQNTADIVAGCLTDGIAARLADDYTLNGVTDWFLPSKDELNFLYHQKNIVDGLTTNHYWSSSEAHITGAWQQDFDNGYQGPFVKGAPHRVRAVRAF